MLEGRVTGDTPGVTRYPHPESNNTLKSKAPASGVPARLRVFCLTPCCIALPNSTSSSAPASPQGLRGVVRPVGLCTEAIWKRRQSSPDPKSGGYARATKIGHRPAPFPPDAGAQEIETHDERLIEAHEQPFCRSAIFPCQKIDDRDDRKFGAPVGRKISARQRREISTRPSFSICNHRVHWWQEPLWLNRAPTERVAQAKAQPGGDERESLASQDQARRHGT